MSDEDIQHQPAANGNNTTGYILLVNREYRVHCSLRISEILRNVTDTCAMLLSTWLHSTFPSSSTNQWHWWCNCSLLAISPLDRRLGSRQTNYVGTVATCVESSLLFMAKSGQCADKLITFFHPFLIKMATKHIFTIFSFWHVPNFWEFNFW